MSDEFINTVFPRSQIKHLDKYSANIEAKYHKNLLNDYENIMQLCFNVNDIVLNVEKTIMPFADKFFVCYIITIKNTHEFPIFPLLGAIKAIAILEIKACKEGNIASIVQTDVGYHISFTDAIKIVNDMLDTPVIFANDIKRITDLKELKELKNVYEKDIPYDMTKDLLMNFLNMLVNNRVRYEYMKRVCTYYIDKSVDISILV